MRMEKLRHISIRFNSRLREEATFFEELNNGHFCFNSRLREEATRYSIASAIVPPFQLTPP